MSRAKAKASGRCTETHHDSYLVGNGRWCSTCFPAGRPDTAEMFGSALWHFPIRRGCNECAGRGRIAFSAEEIISRTIAAGRAGTTVPAGEAR